MTTRGQTLVETLVLLPLVLLLVLGLVQLCQLGTALLVVNYGASSVARKLVQSSTGLASYQPSYQKLMVAGMTDEPLLACQDPAGITQNVTVVAAARVAAFPLIGSFVKRAAPRLSDSSMATTACPQQDYSVPSIGMLTGSSGYQFVIRGSATARGNYHP